MLIISCMKGETQSQKHSIFIELGQVYAFIKYFEGEFLLKARNY